MARFYTPRMWDVDQGEATPEPAYRNRREFIKRVGLVGIGAVGLSSCAPSTAGESSGKPKRSNGSPDDLLAATLRPI